MRLKYKDRLDEQVQVYGASSRSGSLPGRPLSVESLELPKSAELIKLEKQLVGTQADYDQLQAQYSNKLQNPPRFFGKDTHQQELATLKSRMEPLGRKVVELKNAIETQKRTDNLVSNKIDDLARLIVDGNLTKELGSKKMNIGQLLSQVETSLKENQSKTLTPEQEQVRAQYAEMRDLLTKAEREYQTAKSVY